MSTSTLALALCSVGPLLWGTCTTGSLGELVLGAGAGDSRWYAVPSGTSQNLSGVAFLDLNHGFAVGAGGTLLESVDGGRSWTARDSGTTEDLHSIAFTSSMHHQVGYIVGDNGTVLFSHDGGGKRWEDRSLEIPTHLFDVSDAGIAGIDFDDTPNAEIYDVLVNREIGGGVTGTFRAVYSDQLTAGVVADGEHLRGAVYQIDGSKPWKELWRHRGDGAYLQAITSAGEAIIACGYPSARFPGELLVVSGDSGTSWTVLENDVHRAPLNDCVFAPSGEAFAVGDSGSILASPDRGRTWISMRAPDDAYSSLRGVDAVGTRVWAVGDGGTILILERASP